MGAIVAFLAGFLVGVIFGVGITAVALAADEINEEK